MSSSGSPDSNALLNFDQHRSKHQPSGARRAYKACLHCRSRKAKCDLGDIDAPRQPPCARCRRERRECVFAPSYRGGRIVKKNNQQTPAPLSDSAAFNPVETKQETGQVPSFDIDIESKSRETSVAQNLLSDSESQSVFSGDDGDDPMSDIETDDRPRKSRRIDSPQAHAGDLGIPGDIDHVDPQSLAAASLRNPTDALQLLALAADVNRASKSKAKACKSKCKKAPTDRPEGADTDASAPDAAAVNTHEVPSHQHRRNSGHSHQNPRPSRFLPPPPSAAAPTLESYELLRSKILSASELAFLLGRYFARAHAVFPMVAANRMPVHVPLSAIRNRGDGLNLFKNSVLSDSTARALARFASTDKYLLTAIVVITSRQEKMFDVHAKSWDYMQSLINELMLGKAGSLGAVEALLLLSENLPRRGSPVCEDEEHRMAWMLVGMAVRLGYMLGLDQKTLRPPSPKTGDTSRRQLSRANARNRLRGKERDRERERRKSRESWDANSPAYIDTPGSQRHPNGLKDLEEDEAPMSCVEEKPLEDETKRHPQEEDERLVDDADLSDVEAEHDVADREHLAWTYCYIFDRSISIRSGKAFWSRGPGLCFQRTHSGMVPSAAESFPSLRAIPDVQDDFAALLQAYTELTQCMASAHDVLYPSKDRTIALVRVGDYHKYLDEFTRSINGFRLNWENQKWETSIVSECVWVTFHYLRVYIYAFAFQAHVQRSTSTSKDGKKVADKVIFPRGPMASPDARFILEAIEAARELLTICVESLHPSGAMAYLPWRFFLYFSYAGVFLLKAVFVGAVVPADQTAIISLIKKVILHLAMASSDDHHPGVRYARLLNGLLRVFSRGLDGVDSQVSTPKRRANAELPPLTTSHRSEGRSNNPLTQPAPPFVANGLTTKGMKPTAKLSPIEVRSQSSPHALSVSPGTGTRSIRPSATPPTPHTVNGLHINVGQPPSQQSSIIPNVVIHSTMDSSSGNPSANTAVTHSHVPMETAPSSSITSLLHVHSQNTQVMAQHRMTTDGPAAYYPTSHAGQMPPQQYATHPRYPQQQQQQQQQQQHLYNAAQVHQQGPPPNSNGGYPVNSGMDIYPTGVSNFQFDLNWSPMEADGLAHMLSDDHALDGDFWMSLPNHAQWQTWPSGANGSASSLN